MNTSSGKILKIIIPVLILAIAILAVKALVQLKPEPPKKEVTVIVPRVRTQVVVLSEATMTVKSQGTVGPRTQSQLIAQVGGPVLEVASRFANGHFFTQGDILVKIDPFDYRQQVIAAQSDLAMAELVLARENAEAGVARREWADLGRDDEADPLTLREPQVAQAEAALSAAKARLEKARRDLERTEIRAPYDGRIRNKTVDLGQFVGPGSPLAIIYAIDQCEIRLPLPNSDLRYVDVPLGLDQQDPSKQPAVEIKALFAGEEHTWNGRIVRTEAEIDGRSRMIHLIAQVEDPYGRDNNLSRPPLTLGMFVTAEIRGRTVDSLVEIPRGALRGKRRVWVLDLDQKLRFRDVEVFRRMQETVLISDGLEAGERVIVSPLEAVSDGMNVAPFEDKERVQVAKGTNHENH